MPLKKSELYASLWKSCDELRGGMDASQYKDYVLALLFMKYVSDKAASQPDYDLIVPTGGSFADMVALKGKANIGEGINKTIATLAEANENLRGAIDVADFNDPEKLGKGKEMVDRLTNLVAIFEDPSLDFRGNSAEGDDLLGDAYEYLMRNFATESGKSKGQFYTPAEVSRIMAAVVGVGRASPGGSIYDPTCGSGSLLLKAHDAAQAATGLDLAIYGQEMDNATAALARMNMVLHDATTAEIWQDNTLAAPHWRDDRSGTLKTFDFVVANPPFSTKSWMTGFDPAHDAFDRFRYGMPPPKNGDYAFLLHMLASLKSTGRAAVILPHGVLFRGNQEAVIRRGLIRHGFIEGIIGLPPNLFYGTSIPACIIVLDKAGAEQRDRIFLVDASRGFAKDGNKNRLRERDIHRIVDTFSRRQDVPGYARAVRVVEVEGNSFNLNLARYVDSREPEDVQDIEGHLRGGIPDRDLDALSAYWNALPGVRDILIEPSGRVGYSQPRVDATTIKPAIVAHESFAELRARAMATLATWRDASRQRLLTFPTGDRPKALIEHLAEGLLESFRGVALVDAYGLYQRLMTYWADVLQDDAYLIAAVGWQAAARPRLIVETAGQKAKESPDFVAGKQKFRSDLVPAAILVGRYLAEERAAIEAMQVDLEAVEQQIVDLTDVHGVEGGLLDEVVGENGKVTKQAVNSRLKETRGDPDAGDERAQLTLLALLLEDQAHRKATLNLETAALNRQIATTYGSVSEEEIKALVIEEKWFAAVEGAVVDEIAQVSDKLANRVRRLAVRYAQPLPQILHEVACLEERVEAHLDSLVGSAWRVQSG
jgi:type I restriction enzyme M protein